VGYRLRFGQRPNHTGELIMPYFDRFDVCEAYYLCEMLWNASGWLQERESNRRRREATGVQLVRMRFRPRPSLARFSDLTENGQEIYRGLCERYGFPDPSETED
jgi:hypothetical protein